MDNPGSDNDLAVRWFAAHKAAATISEIADTLQPN